MKITAALFIAIISCVASAQTKPINQDKQIMQPINSLFDAMREHDGEKLLKQFSSSAKLEGATIENEVKTPNLHKFAEFVGKSKKKYMNSYLM